MKNEIVKVKEKHKATLLSYPNVVGIAVGLRQRKGEYTGEKGIVVFVKKKKDISRLKPEEIIPADMDGIPIDVQESGELQSEF
ncbi:hypothetical protein ACFLRM_00570 [Acidobacteriota bacterium]